MTVARSTRPSCQTSSQTKAAEAHKKVEVQKAAVAAAVARHGGAKASLATLQGELEALKRQVAECNDAKKDAEKAEKTITELLQKLMAAEAAVVVAASSVAQAQARLDEFEKQEGETAMELLRLLGAKLDAADEQEAEEGMAELSFHAKSKQVNESERAKREAAALEAARRSELHKERCNVAHAVRLSDFTTLHPATPPPAPSILHLLELVDRPNDLPCSYRRHRCRRASPSRGGPCGSRWCSLSPPHNGLRRRRPRWRRGGRRTKRQASGPSQDGQL